MWNTPRDWVTGEIISKVLLDAQIRDNLNYLKVNIALGEAVDLTLDTDGAITKSYSHHTVDTFESAASDDLVTINGGAEGEVILIRPTSGARTIILKHNTGNLWSINGGDIALDDADDYALLIYSGSKWVMIGGGGGAVDTSGSPEDNDYAKFTDGNTIEGRNYAEVRGDLGVLPSIDEDTMVSNSEAYVPTQQSVVAFVAGEFADYTIERLAEEPPLKLSKMYHNTTSNKLFYCKDDEA